MRERVEQILVAAERATSLTRQLLAFSRKHVLAPVGLSLNGVLTHTEKLLRRLIGEDLDLLTVLDPALWPVRADRGQLEQVVLNLAVNARDAMPHGGRLTLETTNVELEADQAQLPDGVRPGHYVRLAVSDTGCGMDEPTQARLFEPFFTTKEVGKGTGLGLATVYGIVEQSGGHIDVCSEPGKGSSFKVYLPRLAEPAPPAPAAREPEEGPRGTETVLVVEDEAVVRSLVRQALQERGYRVLVAQDGVEALRVFAEHGAGIQLVLTDVVMPEMGGRVFVERARVLRPEVKFLFMSGYTDDALVRPGLRSEATAFLHKPFTPLALTRLVRQVLDQ